MLVKSFNAIKTGISIMREKQIKKEYALHHFRNKMCSRVFAGWNNNALPAIKLKKTLIGAVKGDADMKLKSKVFEVLKTFKNFRVEQ